MHIIVKISRAAVIYVLAALVFSLGGCVADGVGASYDAPGYLFINEIMSSNSVFAPAADGKYYDWIELYNASDSVVDLSDYRITDNANRLDKCSLLGFSIPADGYFLIYASGLDRVDENGHFHANFKIPSRGGTMILSHKDGTVISRAEIPPSPQNISYGRDQDGAGEYGWFSSPTPGARNSGLPYNSPDAIEVVECGGRISEVLGSNTYINYDEDSDCSDWAELHNTTNGDFDLSGFFLTDDMNNPDKWAFPEGTVIPPDGYLLVWCSGKNRKTDPGCLHTNFSLSVSDEHIALVTPQKLPCHIVPIPPNTPKNVSCGFTAGSDELVFFACPTPGEPNMTDWFPLTAIGSPVVDDGAS